MNVKNVLSGSTYRLRTVKRWGADTTIRPENVAEHCYYVSFYSMLLGNWLEDRGFSVDWRKLHGETLCHDIEEALMTDIPRFVKRATPELFEAVQQASAEKVHEIAAELGDQSVVDHWRSAKGKNREGRILAVADLMSAISYVIHEVNIGNWLLTQSARWEDYVLSFLDDQSYRELWPIVEELLPICRLLAAGARIIPDQQEA